MVERRETPKTPNRPGGQLVDFFPAHIAMYEQCPERYFWKYIRGVKIIQPFEPRLKIGWAAHEALRNIWKNRRDGLEDPDDLVRFAANYLPERSYPPERREQWPSDLQTLAGHLERALEALDATAKPIHIEETFGRALSPDRTAQVHLRSRIDLVLEHQDGCIEHVDYKTGRHVPDLTQAVISRVALNTMLRATDRADRRVVTTMLYTRDGIADRDDLNRERSLSIWSAAVDAVQRIRTAEIWRPNPGPLCAYCEYQDVKCSIRGDPTQV